MNKKFIDVAAGEQNPVWNKLTARKVELYSRSDDIRDAFERDYTRILHSNAYRRLKHKTQVFFNIDNDHICTRMEHVSHVESVSNTIASFLGLNTELTKAIAMGHDLGHAPFGHHGETILRKLSKEYFNESFWHEKNGLRFVDCVELLEDNYRVSKNLNLTYAVRDGIISHCGEVDENGLKPRTEFIDFKEFDSPGKFQPITWEGCVVKISDKIAYVGRDIEDAISLGFLGETQKSQLLKMARANDESVLNTTVIMHNLIIDICQNSSPEAGICLSEKYLNQLQEIKDFNYEFIYGNKRLDAFRRYSELVITEIFSTLLSAYDGKYSWKNLAEQKKYYPTLMSSFEKWLPKYCDVAIVPEGELKAIALEAENEKIFNMLETKEIFVQAIIDFISGMTDRFAIKSFEELLAY
ncbi:MAG: HD domain-containing protein [Clostridia bacterium]|nr:HD domain-containing protein [Clostridia bacterium]